MNFKDLTYLDSLVEKFEREKTSCLPRLLSTSTISQPRPLPRPPPLPSPYPVFYNFCGNTNRVHVRVRCIGKIIGITFLVQKRTRFLLSFLHHSFLFQRIPFFHEIFTFEFPYPLCFIRLGEPLASNPRLLRFCSSTPMISPTQRTLFQSLVFYS